MKNRNIYVVLLIIVSALLIAVLASSCEELVEGRMELVALNDHSSIEGDFYFLGSGTLQERMYYYCYLKGESGLMKMYQIDASHAKINYIDENTDPHITYTYYPHNREEFLDQWKMYNIIFHIPEGSIKRQFNLDLE